MNRTFVAMAAVVALNAAGALVSQDENVGAADAAGWLKASSWSNDQVPSPGNDYINNVSGRDTRTPQGSIEGNPVFLGDSLTIDNGAVLKFKHTGVCTASNLTITAGSSLQNGGSSGSLAGNLALTGAGTVTFNPSYHNRKTTVSAWVTADAAIHTIAVNNSGEFTAATECGFTFSNPSNTFAGTWDVQNCYLKGNGLGAGSFIVGTQGYLDIDGAYHNPVGSLDCNGVIKLDEDLTFQSATIRGVGLASGTHNATNLITDLGIDASALADGLASAGTITVLSDPPVSHSEFTFNSDATPATLILNGVNRMGSSSDDGFYLRTFDGQNYSETMLGHASFSGDRMTVSESAGSLPSFTFRIDAYPRHVSIHLVDTEGIGANDRQYGMRLRLISNALVWMKSLDDVVDADTDEDDAWQDIYWKYPWAAEADGTKGGVALYDGTLDGAELDACLASIWANEPIPHPAGQPSWTEADVLAWVAQYRAKLGAMSQVQFEATNLADLYTLTDTVAFPAGVKRVYMHTATWRGEYWPNYNSITNVNTEVFPNGKADLVAYTEYLAASNIMIRLHNVGIPVGENDAEFLVPTVDRRLDCWGGGTLEVPISSSDTRIRLRVNEGVNLPVYIGSAMHFDYVRIGEEIVRVGSFERTEEEVWVLEGCTRGLGATDALSHAAGEDWAGLLSPWTSGVYGPNYDLDQPDSLMDDLAFRHASFLNDLFVASGGGHLHIDGGNSHDNTPWSGRDYYDRVYSYLEYPVTSSRVGRSIAANFEQSFSGVRDDMTYNYFPLAVGIRLDEYRYKGYPATSILNTHFMAQESIMTGGRRVSLSVPMSGESFGMNELNNHGLSGEVIDLFGYWIELGSILHEDDVAYVAAVTTKTPGSNHYETDHVLVLGKNGSDEYIFTPHHVMSRTTVDDGPFYMAHQEKGGAEPMQSITSGTAIEVDNPYAAQELQFVVRVHEDASGSLVDPSIQIAGAGSLSITGTVNPGEFLQYTGGTTAKICDKNWNTLSEPTVTQSGFHVAAGNNTITATQSGGSVDIETQYIVTDAAYVLKTNDRL
ncbi:hypothetical protein PDESU_02411 [Pontiella desulfatans]|uniref:G8 domain-containing protein n=1 Tax=Pontiella desulfatans TaxID=2750659 RepID=A0A6C2U2H2_PONDE|nr:hypothetical protein [Pontiella desulfatans]VGO13854.1 hypothetical protein PDESU_02411 [Pontiella desulfatans]